MNENGIDGHAIGIPNLDDGDGPDEPVSGRLPIFERYPSAGGKGKALGVVAAGVVVAVLSWLLGRRRGQTETGGR